MADLPYDFLFGFLDPARVEVKKMFGHHCLYFDGRMVLFLIAKEGNPDNGVCLATSSEHIPALKKELPALTHLEAYGATATDWRLLPARAPTFEAEVERACRLIAKGDPRIGREPKSKAKRKPAKRKAGKRR